MCQSTAHIARGTLPVHLPYFIYRIGTTPQIEIVDKVSINFTGGRVVAYNTATVSEVIGAFAMATFPASVHTYGGHVLLRHARFRSFG
jgi:hypothetical protein